MNRKKLISFFTSLCLLVGCFVTPASAAAPSAVYAKPITEYSVRRTGTVGNAVRCIDGYDIYGEKIDRLLEWNIAGDTFSRTYYPLYLYDMDFSLSNTTGFLFYLSVPAENTVAIGLELSMPDSSRWNGSYAPNLYMPVGGKYQILRDGADVWEERTFVSTNSDSENAGGIYFEGAFSGFVKVSYSQLKKDQGFSFSSSRDALNAVTFRFASYGGDCGAVTAGPVMAMTKNGTLPQVILPDEYAVKTPSSAEGFSTYQINNGDLNYEEVPFSTNNSITAFHFYGNNANAKYKNITYTQMNEPLADTDGIMLYMNTLTSNSFTLLFTLNDPADPARKPFPYAAQMMLYAGRSYYVLPDGSGNWSEKTVVRANAASDYRGNMVFDGAFSGYIYVPYTSFENDSGFTLLPEIDTLFDLTVYCENTDSEMTVWGGLSANGVGTEKPTEIAINRRGALTAGQAEHGTLALDKTSAAAGSRIEVVVTPDQGYKLCADGLTVNYETFTGVHKTIVTDYDAEKKCFYFTMPDAESVTVEAKFSAEDLEELVMLEPEIAADGEIRIRIRYAGPAENSATDAGILMTDYGFSGSADITHDRVTDGTVNIACDEIYAEAAPENGGRYTDYSLLLTDITESERDRRYTTRGYALTQDGTVLYTDLITLCYNDLLDSGLPVMERFGNPVSILANGLNYEEVSSPIPEYSNANAVQISSNGYSCDLNGLQDALYCDVTYENMPLKNTSDLVFYVKNGADRENYLFLWLYDQNGTAFKLCSQRKYQLMEKGTVAWEAEKTVECEDRMYGALRIPAGFEGFVRLPILNLYENYSLNAQTQICRAVYRFSYVGNGGNAVTVGPIFGTEQSLAGNVSETVSLPAKSTERKVTQSASETFATYAMLYWEAESGAESYEINAYVRYHGVYRKIASHTVYSASGAIYGLYADTECVIQITALDKRDEVIAYYAPIKITTALSDPKTVDNGADIVYDSVDYSKNEKDSVTVNRSYTSLSAENSYLLDANPNRGLRGYMDFYHFDITDAELYARLDGFTANSRYTSADTSVYVCYLYPGDYRGKDLDSVFYDTVQKIFDYCRQRKLQLLLRFAYYDVNNFNDRTPTTDELVLHIRQLAQNGIIARNSDVIHVFQAGFIGQYGEWHSDEPAADRSAVLSEFVKLLPDGIYSQLRMFNYKQFLPDGYRHRFGIAHDGFFGIMDASELGSQTFSYGLPEWNDCLTEAAYTPNDAETYYWDSFNQLGLLPEGYACILGASQLRLTTLSGYNGYGDIGSFADGSMNRWKNLPITENWLQYNGLPVSEKWFKDSDGNTVARNAFEYMRDYLGYRISLKALSSVQNGDKTDISLSLVNYGFSAAFNLESSMVILDENSNIVSQTFPGEPSEWYCTDPNDYADRTLLTHKVTCSLEIPKAAGEYKVAFCLRSKSGAYARLDNNVPYENGFHILHTFRVF